MDKTALSYDKTRNAARALTQVLAGTWFLNEGKQMIDRGHETIQSSLEGKPRATMGNSIAMASRAAGLLFLLSPAAHGAGYLSRYSTAGGGKLLNLLKAKKLVAAGNKLSGKGKEVGEAFHALGKHTSMGLPVYASVPLSMGVPVVADAWADQLRGKPVPNVPGLTGYLQEKLFGKVVPDTGADTDIAGTLKEDAKNALDKLKNPRKWFGLRAADATLPDQKEASLQKEAILPVGIAGAGYLLSAIMAYASAKQALTGAGQMASGIGSGDWKRTLGGAGNTALGLAFAVPMGGTAIKGIPAIMSRLYRGHAIRQGMKLAPELAAVSGGKAITRTPGIWNGIKGFFSQPDKATMSALTRQAELAGKSPGALRTDPRYMNLQKSLDSYRKMMGLEDTTGQFVDTAIKAVTPAPVTWGMNKWNTYVRDSLQRVPKIGGVLPVAASMGGWHVAQKMTDKLVPPEQDLEGTPQEMPRGEWRNPDNPAYRSLIRSMSENDRRRLYQPVQAVI